MKAAKWATSTSSEASCDSRAGEGKEGQGRERIGQGQARTGTEQGRAGRGRGIDDITHRKTHNEVDIWVGGLEVGCLLPDNRV